MKSTFREINNLNICLRLRVTRNNLQKLLKVCYFFATCFGYVNIYLLFVYLELFCSVAI
jgi:hypothetical protein